MLDFDSLLFNIDIKTKKAAPGSLLVAEPFLRDAYFNHSVIQMVECDDGEKAMGIVVNQPIDYTLQQLLSAVKRDEPVPMYCGGPMSCDRLYFIHTLGSILGKSRLIGQGLYIGGDFDRMTEYVNAGYPVDGHIRFFLGYSGWDAGQLDQELHDHVWGVADPVPADVILKRDGDAMWHDMVRFMGPDYRNWLYHPKNVSAN